MSFSHDDELLIEKFRAVLAGPDGPLFIQILEAFYQRGGPRDEYFTPEDLLDFQEGFDQIRQGDYLDWEDFKRDHQL
ncbi:MAG: hypothetical protein JRI57_05680 [Deltaproteobacteria bacterium]|nr:hypothetical protein [Deltaproteobacteria bacterium]MBW1953384.1 hypothetical protein [Deltaproteobacteria bacterium]MBW1986058.1 hypothetical protein [Deltaproteobacteria bacterium]MBW2133937.1 hypothetical protein [Deltaproteobacteria bacterium]